MWVQKSLISCWEESLRKKFSMWWFFFNCWVCDFLTVSNPRSHAVKPWTLLRVTLIKWLLSCVNGWVPPTWSCHSVKSSLFLVCKTTTVSVLQKASLIGFCLLNEAKVVPWWGGWSDPVSAWSEHTKEAGFPLTVQTWIWFVHQRRWMRAVVRLRIQSVILNVPVFMVWGSTNAAH